MSDWARLRDLEVEIEDIAFDRLEQDVSSDFTRVTTVVRLRGGGEEGVGEDVVYSSEDQDAAQQAGPPQQLKGTHTLESFSKLLGGIDLFPTPPEQGDVMRLYRTWAYESAALDLALRQAGTSLHARLGREPRPLTYVVSLRLGEPPSLDPVTRRLAHYPGLRFKLDPTSSWTEEIVAGLIETGSVDSVDFKGHYSGTVVDQDADPALYRRVVEAFPDAWIEDPKLVPATNDILAPHHDRITWDAPIHSVADIEGLAFPPKMVNIKPSRFGSLENLFAGYAYCEERGIRMYGGGQFELGPGRGHIQLLASIFHPDTPNDVSPAGFHAMDPPPGLPESPIAPAAHDVGFRWG
jgi:L-alanine-DL-glutamate epimerase-like enolase superfamily enzyme